MKTSLVFMAAGFGTRFGGGIKQLEPVGPNGEILMDYAVYDALKAGFDRVIFIIRRDLEKEFRAGVGRRTEGKCEVAYVYQDITDLPAGFTQGKRQKPWGTGQAVLACRNVIDEPFCVLNADDFYGREAFAKIHSRIVEAPKDALDLCMAGYVLGNTLSESGAVTRGICQVSDDGELQAIRETKGIVVEDGAPRAMLDGQMRNLDASSTVSMNIWGAPACFMDYLAEEFVPFLQRISDEDVTSEYLLPTVVGKMVREGRGRVKVLPTSDKWFGMTYAADKVKTKQEIRSLIDRGVYPDRI